MRSSLKKLRWLLCFCFCLHTWWQWIMAMTWTRHLLPTAYPISKHFRIVLRYATQGKDLFCNRSSSWKFFLVMTCSNFRGSVKLPWIMETPKEGKVTPAKAPRCASIDALEATHFLVTSVQESSNSVKKKKGKQILKLWFLNHFRNHFTLSLKEKLLYFAFISLLVVSLSAAGPDCAIGGKDGEKNHKMGQKSSVWWIPVQHTQP